MRRQNNATETPYWIINDNRKKTSISPIPNNKKLTIHEPVKRVAPIKTELKKQNYTSFVSDYSRIHGMNYKEALQSKEIKNLYKAFNQPQNGQEFFVKHSFEQPRQIYKPSLNRIGETIYIDNRNNQNIYEPSDIKQLTDDQNKLQISRGLYVDLKRSYLEAIRASYTMNAFFKNSGHTQENLRPISEAITRSIYENALKNRSQNIFSVSPFLELSILTYSFNKYQSILNQQNRVLIENPLSNEAPNIIAKLGSTEGTGNIAEIREADTFFLNISSLEDGINLIPQIVKAKTDIGLENYDIIFTNSQRKMETITDFFNNSIGEEIVNVLFNGSTLQKENILKTIRQKNGSNFILQEETNEQLANLNLALKNYSGDQRALLEKIKNEEKDKLIVYYNTEIVKKLLERGDFFKTNQLSKKIYQLFSIDGADEDNLSISIISDKGLEKKLQSKTNTFKLSNLRKVTFIDEKFATPASDEITYNRLIENLPANALEHIYMVASGQDEKLKQLVRNKKATPSKEDENISKEDENATSSSLPPTTQPPTETTTEPTNPTEPTTGEGIKGGSLSNDMEEFKKLFNPIFSYIGKSGIENIYKLSF